MPLSKSIATNLGVPATYWMITAIAADLRTMQVTYTFSGFKDAAAQQAGSDPLTAQDMTFPVAPGDLATLQTVVGIGEGHAVATGLLVGASQVA